MSNKPDVLVIGGGVIGVSTAYFLAQKGLSVTLVEKGEIAEGSSYGNAGLICPSHSMPLAAPGVLTQGLKWLLDPESPFYIKPRLDLELISWLWRFSAHCNQKALRRAIPIFRDLHRASLALYQQVVEEEKLDCHFDQRGILALFNSEHGYKEGQHEVGLLRDEFGLEMTLLDGAAAREIEPTIHRNIVGAIQHHEDGHVDPALFVKALAERVQEMGVQVACGTAVEHIESEGQQVTSVRTSRGTYQPKEVVLAAGIWSTEIARQLQFKLPMQPAKGYSITIKKPENGPQIPVYFGEARVAVTPMGPHLRFAGTLELAGFDMTTNQRRVNAILKAVDLYFENLGEKEIVEVWRGFRPTPPDSLPYIGRSQTFKNLIVATGHSYLGQSMGPATGKLVTQLACEEKPMIELDALRPDRFNR